MNRTPILFLNVLIIATCGLVYELLAATQASYYLGDSVTQFSLIIGIYLSAMGLGSWLSRFIGGEGNEGALARAFLEVELGVALLGGLSVPILLVCYGRVSSFSIVLYGLVGSIGTLVGLELPLLMRIIKDHLDFKELVSRVLAFDYMGALIASVLFPLLFVPRLGLVRTSLLFGMLNAGVALWGTWLLRSLVKGSLWGLRVRAMLVLLLLAGVFVIAEKLTAWTEEAIYGETIVFARNTPYQRIVITQSPSAFQLYLNGHLQFHSADEYRYHEALVHPALSLARDCADRKLRVAVLGGGDGLALREVLRYSSVGSVTLVDIDPEMTQLSQHFVPLRRLNENAYADPRVKVVNQDAFIWLEQENPSLDLAIIDFPDPHSFSLGKLYTTRFYKLLKRALTNEGMVGIQCTSPWFARNSFWCIIATLEAAGFHVHPYHATVPAFGIWGFALASPRSFDPPITIATEVHNDLRYLNNDKLLGMFTFPRDLDRVPVKVNRLDNQRLVRYYESERRRQE